MSVDPLADMYPSLSPYTYVANNPLNHTDPDGRSIDGEFELDKNGDWQKVSTKGDEIGVDFYHFDAKNGDAQKTYVTDRQGNWSIMNEGRYALQSEQRGDEVNYESIYNEWQEGTGPARSVFEGIHPSNMEIKSHYLFENIFDDFQASGKPKDGYTSGWGPTDAAKTGKSNMQAQMMGDYNASFYKLGSKTFTLLQDSKSRTSFYLHMPVKNFERGTKKSNKQANTYQSYIFFH